MRLTKNLFRCTIDRYDIVLKSGAWFSIVNIDTGEVIAEKIHGQDAVLKLIESDEDMLSMIESLIEARIDSDEVNLEEPEETE